MAVHPAIATQPGPERVIHRVPMGTTAFVGRTLKGPVDQPVRVGSFAEFQQIFGGLWQPSTLSYAVEQFFDNGGRAALIVRVVNGARAPTLALPAATGCLRLAGVHPGSREYLRASVDYDGIDAAATDRFNLVIQRLGAAGTEQVWSQEILRRISVDPASPRFVADVLAGSSLVRVLGEVPPVRPARTPGSGGAVVGYVAANADGDDGAPLSDYDLIGSAPACTGLFALKAQHDFGLLYLPPPTRAQDLGLSVLLVAARLCRERRAVLVVDPPHSWTDVADVQLGLPRWPFRSDHAAMFFPRVLAFDRLRNREMSFAPGAAAAGMLARQAVLPLRAQEGAEAQLRPLLRAALPVTEADGVRLAQLGVNTLQAVRPARGGSRPRTLSAGPAGAGGSLAARRLEFLIATSIERGTRWVQQAPNEPGSWERAAGQVGEFLESLRRDGAFAAADPGDSWFVVCDARVNRPDTVAAGAFNLLYGYALLKPADFHCWLVSHKGGECRVRPVSVNRLATAPERVEWEIETAILKRLVLHPDA
ncbi:MAG TPA: hypothetical protein VMB48_15560 [Steroidobacteraceae bacterium]|nr:hypothetical protein [Steroidobacteraceae bacterium]